MRQAIQIAAMFAFILPAGFMNDAKNLLVIHSV